MPTPIESGTQIVLEPQPELVDADLPEGWVRCTLGDHVYIAGRIGWRGLKAEEYTPSGPLLLSVPNLNYGDAVDFQRVNHISRVRYEESPEIKLKEGDTILVKDGAGIGKLGYVERLPGEATVNSSLLVVRPQSDLLTSKYLFYYLKGPAFQRLANERITGSATPHLFQKDIKLMCILAPPPDEQRRIVHKVEGCLSGVVALRDRLSPLPAILKRFRQSALASAWSGRLTEDWRDAHSNVAENGTALAKRISETRLSTKSERVRQRILPSVDCDEKPCELPDTWVYERLGNLCSQIADIDHKMPKAVAPQGVKFISAKDLLDDGSLNLTRDIKLISEADYVRLSRKAKPQRNDIIYSRIGARLGKARLVETDERFLASYSCCIVRPLIINPKYLMRYLDSGVVLAKARQQAKSIGVPDLGLDEINNFVVPLAPLDEQEEIVRRLDALLTFASSVERHANLASRSCDKLTQSILAKAFRGELVPTEAELARREGREYEPASVLLERIKAARTFTIRGKEVTESAPSPRRPSRVGHTLSRRK